MSLSATDWLTDVCVIMFEHQCTSTASVTYHTFEGSIYCCVLIVELLTIGNYNI